MAKTMTYDEAFVRLTVAGDEVGIKTLLKSVDRAKACPECGGTDIMDNGETALRYLTFCCSGCGHQWDAVQDVVR
jgi:formate dehydrogenase maturation protein FdhE